ncbi:MAG: hypothetical protein Q4D53_08135, partial [Leptotrichiaceae bacterium]|nr:hypothetical protein [Leptotrichiaceae bacterium]
MNKEKLKELVKEIILEMIDNGELKLNTDYEVEYTQKWLNNWLMEWILDGYTTKEVMFILEYFETFECEKAIEIWENIPYEIYPGHSDTYE